MGDKGNWTHFDPLRTAPALRAINLPLDHLIGAREQCRWHLDAPPAVFRLITKSNLAAASTGRIAPNYFLPCSAL